MLRGEVSLPGWGLPLTARGGHNQPKDTDLDTQENVETQAQAIAAPGGITMKQLLEAGVHFGHQTKRWNPKMKPYIFGARNGIYIIDLQKTVAPGPRRVPLRGRRDRVAAVSVLFVGTKKQAQDVIREEASRAGSSSSPTAGSAARSPTSRPSSRASTG